MIIKKENVVKIAKCTFKLTATIGASIIVKSIFDSVMPRNPNPAKKIVVLVGGYVLSDMIVEKVSEEAGKSWDRVITSVSEIKESFSSEKHTI